MNNKTLLIMAAGMGSRFGGLKQIEPMGPNGEFIIDYSIYDAIKQGFNKVVFIIKEENYEIFKSTIGARVEPHIQTEYVFQNNDYVPEKYLSLLGDRTKPLGTGYAILCAKDHIHEPFAVINADDFYGSEAFEESSKMLENLKETKPYEYVMICYKIKNTLTENGTIKRGLCSEENGVLKEIIESYVEVRGDKIFSAPLTDKENMQELPQDHLTNMNLLLFTPSIFEFLEKRFEKFLEDNKEDLSSVEFFLPYAMFDAMAEGYAIVKTHTTDAKWYGVTFKEDAELVRKSIKGLVEDNTYPNKLWN
ncbi:MAG: nucleotidyltransferase [Bacilli bacterium]|nr:nucleotidyltransferase [Bacilli bacterium]